MANVKIYYLPFDFETFVPVTIDTIEGQASCVLDVDGTSSDAKELRDLFLRLEPGAFDNRVVRVKAVGLFPHETYVDVDAGVLMGRGGKEGRLGTNALSQLKVILQRLAREQGCDSSR
jgi:hypothetical protein